MMRRVLHCERRKSGVVARAPCRPPRRGSPNFKPKSAGDGVHGRSPPTAPAPRNVFVMPIQERVPLTVFKSSASVRLGISFSDAVEVPWLSFIHPGGAAATSGLLVGDVILEIDGVAPDTPLAAASMLRSCAGAISLAVLRTVETHEDVAVTKIICAWRGYEQREAKKFWNWAATEIQRAWRGTYTRWDIADWLNGYAIVLIQAMWRGLVARRKTASLLQAAATARTSEPDRKQVNQIRRALSFNRKPRKKGKDGGEFSALLEGSAEDVEARLLARRHQTARAIEKAMHAVEELAPREPTDAEMADPEAMQEYMAALGEHAARQREVLQEHDAAVRENRWVSEQLVKLDEAKQQQQLKQIRRASSFERRKQAAKQKKPAPIQVAHGGDENEQPAAEAAATTAAAVATKEAMPHSPSRPPLSPLNGAAAVGVADKAWGAGATEAGSLQSVVTASCSPALGTPTPTKSEGHATKYQARVARARKANMQRAASSPAIQPVLVHPVGA